jgi:hypothetical protein
VLSATWVGVLLAGSELIAAACTDLDVVSGCLFLGVLYYFFVHRSAALTPGSIPSDAVSTASAPGTGVPARRIDAQGRAHVDWHDRAPHAAVDGNSTCRPSSA